MTVHNYLITGRSWSGYDGCDGLRWCPNDSNDERRQLEDAEPTGRACADQQEVPLRVSPWATSWPGNGPTPLSIQQKKWLRMLGPAIESSGRTTAVVGQKPSREFRLIAALCIGSGNERRQPHE